MKIRAQIGMVLNLDKCIGCHTGSVTCKNVWTSRGNADYEDRFVIPTTHREQEEEAYDLRGGGSFTDTNGCSTGISKGSIFGGKKRPLKMPTEAM